MLGAVGGALLVLGLGWKGCEEMYSGVEVSLCFVRGRWGAMLAAREETRHQTSGNKTSTALKEVFLSSFILSLCEWGGSEEGMAAADVW